MKKALQRRTMLRAKLQAQAETSRKPNKRRWKFLSSPRTISPSPSELANAATETERSSESSSHEDPEESSHESLYESSYESPHESSYESPHESSYIKESETQVKDRKTRQSRRIKKPSKRLRDNEEDRVVLEQARSLKRRKTVERHVEKGRKNKARKKLDLLLNHRQSD
jgi:hypothetical protein